MQSGHCLANFKHKLNIIVTYFPEELEVKKRSKGGGAMSTLDKLALPMTISKEILTQYQEQTLHPSKKILKNIDQKVAVSSTNKLNIEKKEIKEFRVKNQIVSQSIYSYKALMRELSIDALRILREKTIADSHSNFRHFQSQFIQQVLYIGDKGKISECGIGDLIDYFNDTIEALKISKINIKKIFAQMILALEYLHSKGIIHGDIKIENFLVMSTNSQGEPQIKLADLDTIRMPNSTVILGTQDFLPPYVKTKQWFFCSPPIKVDDNSYLKANKFELDCYALGKSFEILYNHTALLEKQFKKKQLAEDQKEDFFDNEQRLLAKQLIDNILENNSKNYTIKQAMKSELFGKTKEDREKYFNDIRAEFSESIYYNGYYQGYLNAYPEYNNTFYLLSKPLQDLFMQGSEVADLIKTLSNKGPGTIPLKMKIQEDGAPDKIYYVEPFILNAMLKKVTAFIEHIDKMISEKTIPEKLTVVVQSLKAQALLTQSCIEYLHSELEKTHSEQLQEVEAELQQMTGHREPVSMTKLSK